MKHVLFPILLLTAVAGFCLYSANYVSNTIDEANRWMSKAEEAYKTGDRSGAADYLNRASDHWTGKQVFCGTVLKHEEIDQVSGEFARLLSYVESGDQDDFLSNCSALQTALDHIKEMEWPYLQNIL